MVIQDVGNEKHLWTNLLSQTFIVLTVYSYLVLPVPSGAEEDNNLD